MRESAENANAEIAYGKLAQTKGYSQEVKTLGQNLQSDGQYALAQLRPVAQASGATLPGGMSNTEWKSYEDLNKLQGRTFDDGFLKRVESTETHAADQMKTEADKGFDSSLKAFASQEVATARSFVQQSKAVGAAEKQKK
jgi:putative membrane protein